MFWTRDYTVCRYRGRLGSILPLSINIGMLIIFISDYYLSFYEISSLALTVLFLFICCFTFFPDTPRQLYKIRRKEVCVLLLYSKKNNSELYLLVGHSIASNLSRHTRFGVPNGRLLSNWSEENATFFEIRTRFHPSAQYVNEMKLFYSVIDQSFMTHFSGEMAFVKSLIISIAIIAINVFVNWFLILQLSTDDLLDGSLMSIDVFRIVVTLCQISGSILCLTIVDFIERKVRKINSIILLRI